MEFLAGGGAVPYQMGMDFLRANSFIVDSAAGRLIYSKSLHQIPAAGGAVGDGGLYAVVCATPLE